MKNKNKKDLFKYNNQNNLYLSILIILLIISFAVSFKSGEELYYLINTNLNGTSEQSNSEIATWGFTVRIEY